MKQILFAIGLALATTSIVHAGHLGLDGFGGHKFGGRHGGGLGGALDTERLQTRFETKFDDLVADYDTGLAELEDFYNSEEYVEIVAGTESLADRYDFFLYGVERAIAHLDDYLATLNDDLTYYADLLAAYQARDDLSEVRLERIETRLTGIQDHLSHKIEVLTVKQTALADNFGSYESFAEEVAVWLAGIVEAGNAGTESGEGTAATLASTSVLRAIALAEPDALNLDVIAWSGLTQAATAVPEPGIRLLGATALIGAVLPRRRPRKKRDA
jgi:hypothetical protein